MIARKAAALLAATAPLLLAACAIRLGGPKPLTVRVLAYAAPPGASAADVASQIQAAQPHHVILAADADSAWFGDVARATSRESTRPGRAESVTFAFLAGKALGDTTVMLTGGAHRFTVHDALYDLTKRVRIDVMAFRLGAPTDDAREIVRALMAYVATDVPPQALVLLGVLRAEGAGGDALTQTLSPFFRDAGTCEHGPPDGSARAPIQLFYAPAARTRCRRASLSADGRGLILELETRG
ncbi:MAG: hypothetical protein HY704_03675 [Gemmatimonadetes bacterium]|nr:hypothetical protein [Gemmatimonadota bacterium]